MGNSLNRRDPYSAIPQLEKQLGSLSKYVTISEGKINVKISDLYGKELDLELSVDGISAEVQNARGEYASLGLRVDAITARIGTAEDDIDGLETGKSTVYTGLTPPDDPQEGDLWFQGDNYPILTYSGGAWVEMNEYTDDTLAESKRRVFQKSVAHPTPYPPYDAGDMFVYDDNGAYTVFVATTSRGESDHYVAGDWVIASTDDTAAVVERNARELLVRTAYYNGNAGTLTCYTGASAGLFTNAAGTVDVVRVTWNGDTPTIGDYFARYGANGISFDTLVNFIIGDANGNCIQWDSANGKINISADTITMGGTTVLTTQDQLTVLSIDYAYQLSSSGTTIPSGTWSSTPVAPTTSQYAWTRTTTTYSDHSTAVTYTVGGKTGTDGNDGDDITIISTEIRYATSSSGTSAPSSGWQSSVPSVSQGYYLWTRTKVTYSDNTTTTSYSVARQGVDGTDGVDVTSQYVTFRNSNPSGHTDSAGLFVHDSVSSFPDTGHGVQVRSTGIDVKQSGTTVAHFGSTTDVGRFSSTGDCKVTLDSNGLSLYWKNGSNSILCGSITYKNSGYKSMVLKPASGENLYLNAGSMYVELESNAYFDKNINYPFAITHTSSSTNANLRVITSSSSDHYYEIWQIGSSSRKKKRDIGPITEPDIDPAKLLDLPVRQFRYKEGYIQEEGYKYPFTPGFIAEEVFDVYPIAADKGDDDEVYDWDAKKIIPGMLALIQELYGRVEQLENAV